MSTLPPHKPSAEPLVLGIDIGGSSIKAGVVDTAAREIVGERFSVPTPQPATPEAIAATVAGLVLSAAGQAEAESLFGVSAEPGVLPFDRIGVALPSVVMAQTARTAANIDPAWIGTRLGSLFEAALAERCPSGSPAAAESFSAIRWFFLNDADAAGLSEFPPTDQVDSAEQERSTLFLTFGTGIGSALFRGGRLYPNTELGHLTVLTEPEGRPIAAEHWASAAVKTREGLSFGDWAGRVTTVLNTYIALLRPEEIVVGGGISAKSEHWFPLLELIDRGVSVSTARYLNDAGSIGAALAAARGLRP